MRLILILFTLSVISASCATKSYPKMLSFTPASVVKDYTSNDLHEATMLAQQFCSSVNKDAQYVSTQERGGYFSGSTKHAFFNCVESQARILQQQNQSHHHTPHASAPYIINNK